MQKIRTILQQGIFRRYNKQQLNRAEVAEFVKIGSTFGLVKVQFIEPPKDYWFVMGEYLPPPYGILQLAAYLENKMEDVEIEVIRLPSNVPRLAWTGEEN